MSSQSQAPDHNNQFDLLNFFPPYPPPPTSYPPPPPELHSNATMHHPLRLLPYAPPHAATAPPPNAGPQILALLNQNKQAGPDLGKRVLGDYVAYDVDGAEEGREPPQQLEVNPITKYGSDPELVIGRQIAVNEHYVCYGLKGGNVRVLNLNTASRSLLRGHTKKVTDMAFYANDVNLLASVSADGRVYVWNICEGPDEQDKLEITGNPIVAIHFLRGEGKGDFVHPRVCWHCNRQDILFVGIGRYVISIDTTEVSSADGFSVEAPILCSIDGLVDGVHLVGRHDGEVTDLSMCQWMTNRLVSASTDGLVKVWEDGKAGPVNVLEPHGGQPVNSAQFLKAPHQEGHIILVTAGSLNREVKLWTSASEEGWLLPTHAESWKCTQILEFKSSAKPQVEEAFFNQTVVLSRASLIVFANAKRNAVYSVHLEYGAYPSATRIDSIAEFTVTMPVLSFMGTTDSSGNTIKLYCVQTQAIQQYALNLIQCLQPSTQYGESERSNSTVSNDVNGRKQSEFPYPISASITSSSETARTMRYPPRSTYLQAATSQENMMSNMEYTPLPLAQMAGGTNVSVASPPIPRSPKLSRELSGYRNPINSSETLFNDHGGNQLIVDSSFDRKTDTTPTHLSHVNSLDSDAKHDEKKVGQNDMSRVLHPSAMFKHPTHLITPSEILMSASSSETINIIEGNNEEEVNIQEVVVKSDAVNAEMEVKVVGEARGTRDEFDSQGESQNFVSKNRGNYLDYHATDPGIQLTTVCAGTSAENCNPEEAREVDVAGMMESLALRPHNYQAEVQDSSKGLDGRVLESTTFEQAGLPNAKGKKKKEKKHQASSEYSPYSIALNSADLSEVPVGSSRLPSSQAAFSQILAMQDMLNQLLAMHKELQKQMANLVALPVTKEGRRLEANLGRTIEKSVKASTDALWDRFQEENVRNEKLSRDRTQQVTALMTNFVNKDLTVVLEKVVKKEMAAIGPAVVRTISPNIERTITSAIVDSFQRGVGDKAVNQLERSVSSRLEATVGRQIQAQFQTSGKHVLQDALKSSLESSVIPAFEKSCKAMFEQVDATFQKGMVEHTNATLQHFESTHSPLVLALRESINSASSMAKTLSGEFVDGQRNLLNLAGIRINTNAFNASVPLLNNGSFLGLHEKVEATFDPTKELSRLISERKYEEAFTAALQRSDVSIVSWLCSQVDVHGLLSMVPLPLSQGVLLSLLQQLSYDMNTDSPRKLGWLTDVAAAINPSDPMIAVHARPIFEQVYQRLHHQRNSPTTSGGELSSIRLLIHVINSMLMTFK